MRINNIGYLIKEGIRGIFLHGFMSFAAVCVTVACLLIVGTFSCLMYNVNIMVDELNQTNEIRVFVDENLTDAEARSVGTKINLVNNVQMVTFVSREQALEDFIADHDGDPAFSGLEPEDLRHRYIVILKENSQMELTVRAIEAIDGVAKVNAEFEMAEGFAMVSSLLQVVSTVFIIALLLVSLVIISNTVKLGMYERRNEIAIMKMVGATNGFIRLPFVVEGFTLGIVGAGIAFAVLWSLYDWATGALESIGALEILTWQPFNELLIPMAAIFAAAGLFVGFTGSLFSIRKFMDV